MLRILRPGTRLTTIVAAFVLWPMVQGIVGAVVAHAQEAGSAPFVSPPVTPLWVTVDPKWLEAASAPPMVTVPEGEPLPTGPPPARQPVPDPVIQSGGERWERVAPQVTESLSNLIVNIPGLTANANPPDTVGDVGKNHFVQMVNATRFQIWDKTGTPLTGSLTFGNLWAVGETCRSNLGDPIVVYDHLADRWLLSQFANPSHMCIAISQTPDPTAGAWFLYTFNVGTTLPDYPKLGVWPDGYYMSAYEPPNLGVYVFNRANMLLGNAASFMKTTIPALGAPGVRDTRILPSDLDGPLPPDGTPNFFVRTVDGQQDPGNPVDRIEIYEFAANWANPSFTFTLVDTLSPAPFNIMLCNRNGPGVRDCIPQPSTTSTVDALSNRPMMQLKFRKFPAHSTIVFNQTIDVSGSMPVPTAEVAGIRWYELRKSGANWTIQQQGTYAPQPEAVMTASELLHRWMGSVAMDKDGNIALGYSVVNDNDTNPVFPGIRYTGRHVNDPPGSMPQGEKTIRDGTNSQTGGAGQRWGDYSALSVDPVDDCTFWYTTHVAGIGGTGARPTQIASFKFDTCGQAAATTTTVTSSANPAVVGQSVTFTATVSVVAPGTGTPTGAVTFLDGATSLGTGTVNAERQATLTTSALVAGAHGITARYAGDTNFATSTSASLTQTINKAATTTALISSVNPSAVGQAVTFTATVNVSAPGAGTPTGTVTFFDGATALGTGTLNASRQAMLTTAALSTGSHSITTQYAGDTNLSGSTSPVLTQVIASSLSTLTVTKTGTGSGTVAGGGISCGSGCSATVASGTSVSLSATADDGATFVGWSGGGCSGTGTCMVTVTGSTTVNAKFLKTLAAGLGVGMVVKAVHFTELRTAVNNVRRARNLLPVTFDPTLAAGTTVKAAHITELRTALDAAYATAPSATHAPYTDVSSSTDVSMPVGTRIKAVHLIELRSNAEALP